MDSIPNNPISVFKAPPSTERKTISIQNHQKIVHPSLVPPEIMKDEFLSSLISRSLPRNYNFEIHKTIWKIKETQAKTILLQLPEGLIRFGPVLVDVMTGYFEHSDHKENVKFVTMGDLTYGACCIDDFLASSMGCDLVVHYAHSCLVPINQLNTNVKFLYVFLDIKFDLEHVFNCIKHNFQPEVHHIALASTIQFLTSVHELAKKLKEENYQITLPQSRPLSSGEVLGCTAARLDSKVNTIVFICDGRFHLEALMIANPKLQAFRYDPYSRKLTRESYGFSDMMHNRNKAIKQAADVIKRDGKFGFILGTLGRQGNEGVYERLVDRLQTNTKCKFLKMMIPEVDQILLESIQDVDVWVQVACPRLSIDWGANFKIPLLNPYEFAQCLKFMANQELNETSYPMDFYAKNSCGDHTPNHQCFKNPDCGCMTR